MAQEPGVQNCPLCNANLRRDWTGDPRVYIPTAFDCPNCGHYYLFPPFAGTLNETQLAVLSHAVWLGQPEDLDGYRIDTPQIKAAESGHLPDPGEQLDLLILSLGKHQKTPGTPLEVGVGNLRAKFGGVTSEDELFIVRTATEEGLIDSSGSTKGTHRLQLTLRGWQRFHEIQRGAVHSRTAFMAMPFQNETVNSMVDDVFRPAVEETGFKLKRADDDPKAGGIVNKIRVDILTSRFVIADLTGNNSGVYWEAGYAEGLGKPVIYTCEKSFFKDVHFDTKQLRTVIWSEDEKDNAAEQLKATIRATLPFEAKMREE